MSKQLICPYCTNNVSEDDSGCCHESSAHFEEVEVCDVCDGIVNYNLCECEVVK